MRLGFAIMLEVNHVFAEREVDTARSTLVVREALFQFVRHTRINVVSSNSLRGRERSGLLL